MLEEKQDNEINKNKTELDKKICEQDKKIHKQEEKILDLQKKIETLMKPSPSISPLHAGHCYSQIQEGVAGGETVPTDQGCEPNSSWQNHRQDN